MLLLSAKLSRCFLVKNNAVYAALGKRSGFSPKNSLDGGQRQKRGRHAGRERWMTNKVVSSLKKNGGIGETVKQGSSLFFPVSDSPALLGAGY